MYPPLYHAHHNRSQEDLSFWLALSRNSPGPILELGCGTGRVMRPLMQAGYPVYGMDIDYEMLSFLRANTPGHHLPEPSIFQADFANFHLDMRFGLIIMPCNTYSSLTSATRTATLKNVRRHLMPAGRFVVSLPNPHLLRDLPSVSEAEVEEIVSHPIDRNPVQISSAWERTDDRITFFWYYDHILADGVIRRFDSQIRHSLILPQEYIDEMERIGFAEIRLYGDFDRSPFSVDSTYLILDASFMAA